MNTTRWQRWAKRALLGTAAAAAIAVMAPNDASANLIYLGEIDQSGAGLGNVNTILTLQSPGGATTEAGSVVWGGPEFGDIAAGDIPPGEPAVQVKTIAAGDPDGELQLVFNAVEPQGDGDESITIDDLDLLLFGADGSTLGEFSLADDVTPLTLASPGMGIGGNEADTFGLDAEQAAQLQALLTANEGARFGLNAALSDAEGGIDTFHLIMAEGVTPPPPDGEEPPPDGEVPEPLTLSLLGSGLAAMGLFGRRRRRRA